MKTNISFDRIVVGQSYGRTLRKIRPFHIKGDYVTITKVGGSQWHKMEQWLIANECQQDDARTVDYSDFQRGYKFPNEQIKMLFTLRWTE